MAVTPRVEAWRTLAATAKRSANDVQTLGRLITTDVHRQRIHELADELLVATHLLAVTYDEVRTAEARLQQVRQHRESLLRHCAEIEREFVPSTRWRAVPLLERAERVGVLKEQR